MLDGRDTDSENLPKDPTFTSGQVRRRLHDVLGATPVLRRARDIAVHLCLWLEKKSREPLPPPNRVRTHIALRPSPLAPASDESRRLPSKASAGVSRSPCASIESRYRVNWIEPHGV